MSPETHWYALKVFYNKVPELKARLDAASLECFCPLGVACKPLVAGLLFVHCTEPQLLEWRKTAPQDIKFVIYTRKEVRPSRFDLLEQEHDVPAPIPEREMEAFMLVTGTDASLFDVLGPDDPKYRTGQRVRVTQGPFAGAEGYVQRIKKDRRLVITVSGIVAIATVHINPKYLEPVSS